MGYINGGKQLKTRVIIDVNHMSIRCLFANAKNFGNPEPELQLHKHMFLTTLFSALGKFSPDEVVLAVDGKGNWRKSIYKSYKENRKIDRENDLFPWDEYFSHFEELIKGIKSTFPFKVIHIPRVEADDIAAVIVKHSTGYRNILVTSDQDYIQLLQHKNTNLFDPMKNKWVQEKDPKRALELKIMIGDKSDNIPAIKPRVGIKTAMKILDTEDKFEQVLKEEIEIKNKDGEIVKTEKVKDNYNRNKKLIDMDFIPNVIIKEVLKRYDKYKIPIYNTMSITEYFIENQLRELNSKVSQIMMTLKSLREDREEFF